MPDRGMSEEEQLNAIKASMTEEQRNDMAALLSSELKRRAVEKHDGRYSASRVGISSKVPSSGIGEGLGRDGVAEVYSEAEEEIRRARIKKLEDKVREAKRQARRMGKLSLKTKIGHKPTIPSIRFPRGFPSFGRVLLIYGLLGLGTLKVLLSTGIVSASVGNKTSADGGTATRADGAKSGSTTFDPSRDGRSAMSERVAVGGDWRAARDSSGGLSSAEQHLLKSLDERRVLLEKRSAALDEREEDLARQARALTERLAELKTLAYQLRERRRQKDERYRARLEQLASVYSSMAPEEASVLIAKLDDGTALGLLERMPGKRIGQILANMSDERAIQLTKKLGDRKNVD